MDALAQPARVPADLLGRGGVDDDVGPAAEHRRQRVRAVWRAAVRISSVAGVGGRGRRGCDSRSASWPQAPATAAVAERRAEPAASSATALPMTTPEQRDAAPDAAAAAEGPSSGRSFRHLAGGGLAFVLQARAIQRGADVGLQVVERSMPTDSRSRPSEMPATRARVGDIAAWVMVAGCATRLSTPPSDSARVKYCRPSTKARTAASPPASSTLSIAPKPCCWRAASAWPGCEARPG